MLCPLYSCIFLVILILDKSVYITDGNKVLKVAQGVNFKVTCFLGPGSKWYRENGLPPNVESQKWTREGDEFSLLVGNYAQQRNTGVYTCRTKVDHILTVIGGLEIFSCSYYFILKYDITW